MAVNHDACSQVISRVFRHTVFAAGALLAISGEVRSSAPWPIHGVQAGAAQDANDAWESTRADVLASPFSVQIETLPAGSVTISLQRVRYEPGVALSAQPIDGPRLLLIESGILSLELVRPGASRFPSGSSKEAIPLAAGDAHQVATGEVVLIPAHVPMQLANTSDEPVVWLQVQAETPPTICACGEDLTGSKTTLLASQTLAQPIAAPAMLTVALAEIAPQQAASAPEDGVVQLIAPLDATAVLPTGGDGVPRNDTDGSMLVYVVTLGARPATT